MAAGVSAVGLGAVLLGVGVPSALAHQDCTTGSSAGNTRTCINAYYPNGAIATATVLHEARTLRECVGSINDQYASCTYYKTVYPGQTITASLNRRLPDNQYYCANTFRLNANGTETQIGHLCIDDNY
ncbi:MAG: hypothetical protein JO057_10940 [Chloroflexi bacterium]|nr:hypothetical protein [Chloroflexota bacterium]